MVNHSVVDIYADDTTLSYSSEVDVAPTSISVAIKRDLDDISSRSANNKMVINAKKTKFLLITGKRLGDKLAAQTLTVRTDDKIIEQMTSQKLLGVILDEGLTFDKHIDELLKKLEQRLGVLCKIKRFVPLAAL